MHDDDLLTYAVLFGVEFPELPQSLPTPLRAEAIDAAIELTFGTRPTPVAPAPDTLEPTGIPSLDDLARQVGVSR